MSLCHVLILLVLNLSINFALIVRVNNGIIADGHAILGIASLVLVVHDMKAIIAAKDLRKKYGTTVAVDNVSL